jgi:hypothetical protein
VAVALLGAFAALTLNVVEARRPFDRGVTESFASASAKIGGRGARVSPLGCYKTSLDYYNCSVEVRVRRAPTVQIRYQIAVTDDGCWLAKRTSPTPPRTVIRHLALWVNFRGCVPDSGR